MKTKSVAAVGALGLGLGIASFIGGTGTASAEQCGEEPIGLTPSNIICNINAQTGTFFMSVNPANQLDTFFNGTDSTVCTEGNGKPECHTENDGLGILDQPQTFVNSLQDFAKGPVSP
jgi:hypothetical protein